MTEEEIAAAERVKASLCPPPDVLHVGTSTQWSFLDRLRILVTGVSCVSARISCEFGPGRTIVGETHAWVPSVWSVVRSWLERRGIVRVRGWAAGEEREP